MHILMLKCQVIHLFVLCIGPCQNPYRMLKCQVIHLFVLYLGPSESTFPNPH